MLDRITSKSSSSSKSRLHTLSVTRFRVFETAPTSEEDFWLLGVVLEGVVVVVVGLGVVLGVAVGVTEVAGMGVVVGVAEGVVVVDLSAGFFKAGVTLVGSPLAVIQSEVLGILVFLICFFMSSSISGLGIITL